MAGIRLQARGSEPELYFTKNPSKKYRILKIRKKGLTLYVDAAGFRRIATTATAIMMIIITTTATIMAVVVMSPPDGVGVGVAVAIGLVVCVGVDVAIGVDVVEGGVVNVGGTGGVEVGRGGGVWPTGSNTA
jgi:hypothetical protein